MGWHSWPLQATPQKRDEDQEVSAAKQARYFRLPAESELSRACADLVNPPLLRDEAGFPTNSGPNTRMLSQPVLPACY